MGGWYSNYIDFDPEGDSSFTFPSTVGNIASIVIHAGYFLGS